MGVEALEYNQGMFFICPNASRKCMWMKNTLIDLSVAFIDRDRKITEIKDLQSESLESICSSRGNIIAAIEMNKGWFKENNVCLLYTSPSPRDRTRSRMPSSA